LVDWLIGLELNRKELKPGLHRNS